MAEKDPLLEAESARPERRVFYHPGRRCNGTVSSGVFAPQALPPGYEYDVEDWVKRGSDGSARVRKRAPAPEPVPEKAAEKPAKLTDKPGARGKEAIVPAAKD